MNYHQEQSLAAQITKEKLVYHKQMIPSRMTTITDYETKFGYITSPNYPKPFEIDSNSVVHLVLRDNQTLDAIRLTFEDINLEFSNHCESESIQILIEDQHLNESKEDQRQQQKQFKTKRAVFVTCGTILPKPLLILRNNLFIQLSSDTFNRGQNRGFKLKFEFLNSNLQLYNGCEQANQFMCRNRLCIPNNLRCNKIDDCGDGSDEDLSALCLDLPTIPYPIDYECGLIDNKMESLDYNSKVDAAITTTSNESTTILTNRIIGGSLVKTISNNGLPFQVSIQLNRVEPISHVCGGTLIHPMFVLSASHCFKGLTSISDYNFKFGLQDLRSATSVTTSRGETSNDNKAEKQSNVVQVRYANSISPYPGNGIFNIQDSTEGGTSMNYGDLTNDFVLIELNAPVVLTEHVWPACLPHLAEPVVAGRECFASGFGDTRGSGNSFKLKQAKQTIIHSSQCHSKYSDFYIDDYTMICVKNIPVNGPCNGDSGGPLLCVDKEYKEETDSDNGLRISDLKEGEFIKYLPMYTENENDDDDDDNNSDKTETSNNKLNSSIVRERIRYTVFGVTSFTTDGNFGGSFCGLDQVPTIYARVSTKVEWILSHMKMVMFSLNFEDNQQDFKNISALFGYMFRSGLSRHPNFTFQMTKYPD